MTAPVLILDIAGKQNGGGVSGDFPLATRTARQAGFGR